MKKIILLLTFILTFINAFSQDEEKKETIYSFVPQYLINRGIRVDIEKPLGERHFLQICPQFYLSEKDEDSFREDNNQYSYLIGGGLCLYNKIFTFEDYKKFGLYLSYGVSYNFFNIEYIDFTKDAQLSATGNIHKVGGDLILGYQFFIKEIVSIDIYTGLGTRFSYMDADGADTDRFNTSYFGYNYTGNLLHLGLRIGVIL